MSEMALVKMLVDQQNNLQDFRAENSLIKQLQNSDSSSQIYSNFVRPDSKSSQNAAIPENQNKINTVSSIQNQSQIKDHYTIAKYRQNVHDTHKKEFWITAGTAGLIGLLALDILIGKKSSVGLIRRLNEKVKQLEVLKKAGKLPIWGKLKLAVAKTFSNLTGYTFSVDKIKDFSLMSFFNKLGPAGRMIVRLSKSTARLTEKFSLKWMHQSMKSKISKAGQSASELAEKLTNKDDKKLAQAFSELVNGKEQEKGLSHFADELVSGIGKRVENMKQIIETNNITPYKEKYIPKNFSRAELKQVLKEWKEFLFNSPNKSKDVLRGNWDSTKEIIENGINSITLGNKTFKESRESLAKLTGEILEHASTGKASPEFVVFSKQVSKLNKRVNGNGFLSPLHFETDAERFAGRVLDLEAGGGMPEVLLMPAIAGTVAYNTVKDTKPEDIKEKFIRNGGVGVSGGLIGWVATSILFPMSGVTGMLIGLGTGLGLELASRKYIRHLDNNKPEKTKQ